MAKAKTTYQCTACSWRAAKWQGQCRSCEEWGTLVEIVDTSGVSSAKSAGGMGRVSSSQVRDPAALAGLPARPARPIDQIDASNAQAASTGVSEFDRVLGGGVVPGAVILLAGEPGVGKSTLLLDVACKLAQNQPAAVLGDTGQTRETREAEESDGIARVVYLNPNRGENALPDLTGLPGRPGRPGLPGLPDASSQNPEVSEQAPRRVLYLTGEESAEQVRLRASRINAISPGLYLAAENSLDQLAAQVAALNPEVLIVDSVQTFIDPATEGAPGGVNQVRAVASGIIAIAKERAIPAIMVGHVTKDGALAGPRMLEHLVDVVCQFEGERHGRLRILRALKNRYGPTDEVGCFDMSEKGIIGLTDPSGLFLSHSAEHPAGSCVTVTLEGRRPLPLEIQSLVSPVAAGSPRRTTSGVDHSRLAMILAVLAVHAGLDLSGHDVYLSTVGGAKVVEPAADLALALAAASTYSQRPVLPGVIALGEVSLVGEVRPISSISKRLLEAGRLGFTRALVPARGASDISAPKGMDLIPVMNLRDALDLGLTPLGG